LTTVHNTSCATNGNKQAFPELVKGNTRRKRTGVKKNTKSQKKKKDKKISKKGNLNPRPIHSLLVGGEKKRGLFQTLVFIAYNQLDSGVCYLILLYDATSLGGLRIKMASSKAIYVWE